jgi:hypothetical protein
MKLFFHLLIHLLSSLVAGLAAYFVFGNLLISIIGGFLGGFLVDLDHFIDYFFVYGTKFNPKYFFGGYPMIKSERVWIVFHGFEYVFIIFILLFFAKTSLLQSLLLGLSAGLFIHLILDNILNNFPIRSYFFIYRLKKDFQLKALISKSLFEKHKQKRRKMGF